MTRTRIGLVVGLAVAALAVTGCGGDDDEAAATDTATPTTLPETLPETGLVLKGSVGPGFEISLSTEDGQPVETLPAGSYTLEVDDQSDIHNFHLRGPKTDVQTGVTGVEVSTWPAELGAGTYEFVCDPHASTMNGSFEVTG